MDIGQRPEDRGQCNGHWTLDIGHGDRGQMAEDRGQRTADVDSGQREQGSPAAECEGGAVGPSRGKGMCLELIGEHLVREYVLCGTGPVKESVSAPVARWS